MQVVVWILIILVVIFLIWLLKRWIKRIIFILILLALAFFIYGIFNPSGAARLWYNVRTFPSRMASRMGSGKEFLDYNTYKSKISSIGDEIGDKIGDKIGLDEDILDVDLNIEEKDEVDEGKNVDFDVENVEDNDERQDNNDSDEKQVIKSFPKSINFVGMPKLKERNEQENKSENIGPLTGYSKTDLLGVINKYIEKNLDEDTDILVTVEYENDSADPQKIILQTQSKSDYLISNSGNLVDDAFDNSHGSNSENVVISSDETIDVEVKPVQKQVQPTKKTTSTKLTQKEQKEAEEIFSILF